MAEIKFHNKAYGNIAEEISASATTIPLISGQISSFSENYETGDVMYMTLTNASSDVEVVRVTAISGDNLTVERGQDGTVAAIWPIGSSITQRIPSKALEAFKQKGVYSTVHVRPTSDLYPEYQGEEIFLDWTDSWFKGYFDWESIDWDTIDMGIDWDLVDWDTIDLDYWATLFDLLLESAYWEDITPAISWTVIAGEDIESDGELDTEYELTSFYFDPSNYHYYAIQDAALVEGDYIRVIHIISSYAGDLYYESTVEVTGPTGAFISGIIGNDDHVIICGASFLRSYKKDPPTLAYADELIASGFTFGKMCQVSGEIFAISGSDDYIRTYSVDADDGEIALLDSYTHSPSPYGVGAIGIYSYSVSGTQYIITWDNYSEVQIWGVNTTSGALTWIQSLDVSEYCGGPAGAYYDESHLHINGSYGVASFDIAVDGQITEASYMGVGDMGSMAAGLGGISGDGTTIYYQAQDSGGAFCIVLLSCDEDGVYTYIGYKDVLNQAEGAVMSCDEDGYLYTGRQAWSVAGGALTKTDEL